MAHVLRSPKIHDLCIIGSGAAAGKATRRGKSEELQ